MNLSQEVLNQVTRYFAGELSLSDLRNWEVKLFLNRGGCAADDRKFLFEFERHYGELSAGLPEPSFKALLRSLAAPSVLEFAAEPPKPLVFTFGTAAESSYRVEPQSANQPNITELVYA